VPETAWELSDFLVGRPWVRRNIAPRTASRDVLAPEHQLTSQSARAPVTELEGQAGVTNVIHGLDVDAMPRQPAVTFGEVTTIEVT
jgi:hypothetical protein